MKVLVVLIIIFATTSCTKYVVEKTNPDGSATMVHVSSTRDLDQPELHYERHGDNAAFDFKAAGVDNNTDAYISMFEGMMVMMNSMLLKLMEKQPGNEQ